MGAPKGNQFAKLRKTHGGGPPTLEQRALKNRAWEIIEENAEKLGMQFIKDAMRKGGVRSLHKAIDKLVPDAKQTIAIEGDALLEQAIRKVRERKK